MIDQGYSLGLIKIFSDTKANKVSCKSPDFKFLEKADELFFATICFTKLTTKSSLPVLRKNLIG